MNQQEILNKLYFFTVKVKSKDFLYGVNRVFIVLFFRLDKFLFEVQLHKT